MMKATGVVMLAWVLLLGGCSSVEDDILANQRTAIEKYLTDNKKDYETPGGIYKYTINAAREGRENEPIVKRGDHLEVNYVINTFSSAGPGTLVIYSNIPEVISEITDLDYKYWPQVPLEIELGKTALIPSVTSGLENSRQGDSVQLFIPSDLAYGSSPRGTVGADTPLVWTIIINKVAQ